MTTLAVNLGQRAYPIHIGTGLIDCPALFSPYLQGRFIAIVTNAPVARLYAARLNTTLAGLGKAICQIVLPDGEAYKSWETLNLIFEKLMQARADRHTTLIALGGGVVGDITGFAAACYMRGIPFIQVPTTLLAQVDASVGGKTGINHPLGKNMIGAFHQPQAVIADIAALRTLSRRELASGIAEVIKMGAIADHAFLDWTEAHMHQLLDYEEAGLAHAIHRCCTLKAHIIAADEREQGARALLNFGHTFGHAIETGLGYGQWLHGEAVGCGMVMAADLSMRLGCIDRAAAARIAGMVDAAQLPTRAPPLGASRYLELMQIDKKSVDGRMRFILLKRLGQALMTEVPMPALQATLVARGAADE